MVGQGKTKIICAVRHLVPATIQNLNELLKTEKILINHSNHIWKEKSVVFLSWP